MPKTGRVLAGYNLGKLLRKNHPLSSKTRFRQLASLAQLSVFRPNVQLTINIQKGHENEGGAVSANAAPDLVSQSCAQCGRSLESDANFCAGCGARTRVTPPPPPVESVESDVIST